MRNALVAVIAIAVAGCENGPTRIACTQAGCSSGLAVELDQETPGPWRVEVFPPGQVSRLKNCPPDVVCKMAFFEGFLPDRVTLTVTFDGRSAHYTNLTTTTSVHYPNGRQCGPECRNTKVVVQRP